MKVTKFVNIEEVVEVEVDVEFEDLAGSITHKLDPTEYGATQAISNFHLFITKVPDAAIAQMNPEKRKLIVNFYKEQIQRFDDNPYINPASTGE